MSELRLQRSAVQRIVYAVVAIETRRLREADLPFVALGEWPETTAIGDEGLGLDSLEQLGALGALAETFGLDDSILGEERPLTVGAWVDWVMRRHAPVEGHITVRTSGSTGSPRLCTHAVRELLAEAAFFANQLPGRRRVVALVPAHHLYGIIWTALLPEVLGVPVVMRTIGTALGLMPGDLVVAVPEQWQAIQRLTRGFPEDIIGISSAGALNDAIAAGLLATGLRRLVDVYGSSETSAIAMRDLPALGYDLLPRWELGPTKNNDWQLIDRDGTLVALPDHVDRINERSLRLIGRRDGAVQIGGHNVWPARVADLLLEQTGVAEASVRLDADGRLKAFIVPVDGQDISKLSADLERISATCLPSHERPINFRFGFSLPKNFMGKLEDWD